MRHDFLKVARCSLKTLPINFQKSDVLFTLMILAVSVLSYPEKFFFFLLRDFSVHFPVIFWVSEVFNIMWVSFNYHVTLSSGYQQTLLKKRE